MASGAPAVVATEVVLARVPIITIIAHHRITPLVPRATAQALVPATAPAAIAAPLAALAQAVAVVVAPLVVVPALVVAVAALAQVAVVVALADKRIVTPNLNPL